MLDPERGSESSPQQSSVSCQLLIAICGASTPSFWKFRPHVDEFQRTLRGLTMGHGTSPPNHMPLVRRKISPLGPNSLTRFQTPNLMARSGCDQGLKVAGEVLGSALEPRARGFVALQPCCRTLTCYVGKWSIR